MRYVQLAPILIFALLVLFLFTLDLNNPVFEPPYLILILNTLFLTISSLVVASISAKSYLEGAQSNMLLLGCAFLINGVAAAVAGWVFSFSINYTVAIYNICTLLSALFQLANASIFPKTLGVESTSKKAKLTVVLLGSFATIAIVVLATYGGVVPKFFVEGSGPTLLDVAVLAASILMFTASSILVAKRYYKSKSPTLFWYSIALALFAIGLLGVSMEKSLGDPIGWTGKIAQYIGGLYFLVAVTRNSEAQAKSTSVSEKWAEAFRGDAAQLETLFAKMLNGFSYQQILTRDGEPIDYVFLAVNDAFEKMTGLKKENVIGKRVSEVLPGIEKDPADWIHVYGKVALTGEPAIFENYAEPLKKWYSVSAYSPKKGYFVTIFEDITERKKTEEALKEAKEQAESEGKRLETILETSPSAVVIVDAKNKRFSYVNKRAMQLYGFDTLGLSVDENVTKVRARRLDGTDYPIEEMPVSRSLKLGQEVHNEEMIIERADGKVLPIIASAAPLRDTKGNITAAIVVFEDITETKKAQEALRESEQLYHTVFDNSQDGFQLIELIYDENGKPIDHKFLKVNHAYEKIIGVKAEDILDKTARYISPNDEPHWLETPDRVLKTGISEHVELYNKDINKTLDCYYFRYSENVVGTLFRDVTERKNMEKQLQEKERLAAIGATAGMVGHDIRNPLQAITSDVYLAKTELASTIESEEKSSIQESLIEIEKNVDYINKIVQDLQDYARPLNPNPGEADLKLIIEKMIQKNSLPKNVKVSIKVEDEARKVVVDTDYLNRILYNLVTNAVQAMPNGGKLTIKAHKEAKNVIISVKDTGVGIPKAIQSKMFTPMFTTKSKGQGFGLPVVKRMTETLGGTVNFESEEGKGTTFTICLPEKIHKK